MFQSFQVHHHFALRSLRRDRRRDFSVTRYIDHPAEKAEEISGRWRVSCACFDSDEFRWIPMKRHGAPPPRTIAARSSRDYLFAISRASDNRAIAAILRWQCTPRDLWRLLYVDVVLRNTGAILGRYAAIISDGTARNRALIITEMRAPNPLYLLPITGAAIKRRDEIRRAVSFITWKLLIENDVITTMRYATMRWQMIITRSLMLYW